MLDLFIENINNSFIYIYIYILLLIDIFLKVLSIFISLIEKNVKVYY
jgi:hypothetical protein